MMIGSYLVQLLSVVVLLGFSGVFKECWTQGDITSPIILVHPQSRVVHINRSNESVTLMCLALGANTTTIYKWEKENSSLPNKTINQDINILILPDLRPSDSGNYRCRVSNRYGTTFSNYAYVNVTGYMKAVVDPHNVTVEITTSVNLSCMANGYEVDGVSYAWEVSQIREEAEASQLHSANSPRLLLNNVTASAAYRCVVTNRSGSIAISAFSYITVVVHPPKIIVHPTSTSVELHRSSSGVNISFSCVGTENSSHYLWERLQGVLPVNSQGETTNTLTVYNVQPRDSGFYRCSVSNNSGTAYSNYATFIVTVQPPRVTSVYINHPPHNVGGQAVFVCRGEGFGRLQFKWQRQNGNIPPSAVIDVNNGTLTIPVLSSSDRGNYRCIVCDDWNGTVYSEYVQLNVSEEPLVINATPESMLARQQSNASFSCVIIDRNVTATFLWSRVDGQPMSSRVHGSNSNVLIIVGVREEDEGEYKCTATTENQTLTATIPLTVYDIPMIHEMQPQHVTEVSAQKFLLTCTAQNDPDSPHPLEITWYKGDNQLTDGQRYRISYIYASGSITISTLTISHVQKGDAGQYSCRIRPGDISTETTVVVNYKPEIISFQILPSNNIMLGKAVQIVCHVEANPLPSVTIYRNNKAMFTTTRRVVDYQIQRVSADDDGTIFSCGAENSVGTVSQQHLTLNVTGIPDVVPTTTASGMTSISTTPTPYPVAVPANVEQVSRGLTSVQIQWTRSQEHTLFFRIKLYCEAPCTNNAVRSFTTVDTSITVYGLEPDHTYVVQVAAAISDGVLSRYSEPLRVSTATSDSVLFQLRLVPETACNEWKTKLDVMTATIVNEITRYCACSLSAVDIFSDTISCDNNDHVIYRAGLAASMLDAEETHTILNEWLTQTSTLALDGSLLQVDHNCPLVLSSFDDPICSSTTVVSPDVDSSSDGSIIPLLAGIIGGIIIGGVLTTILVVILVIMCRGKTDKIRPGGNTPVNGSLNRPHRRTTGRKAQTSEEATYSEVFNSLPLCDIQSCPAYQASVHLDDHDYVDIEGENGNINIPAVFAGKTAPAQLHNELEVSVSSLSCSRSNGNGNDYSEPLTLDHRLDSKASGQVPTQMASNSCSDYLKPVSHKTDSNNSVLDHQDMTQPQTDSPPCQQQEKIPSDYLEPVSVTESQEHYFRSTQQQYDHLSGRSKITNLYSELN